MSTSCRLSWCCLGSEIEFIKTTARATQHSTRVARAPIHEKRPIRNLRGPTSVQRVPRKAESRRIRTTIENLSNRSADSRHARTWVRHSGSRRHDDLFVRSECGNGKKYGGDARLVPALIGQTAESEASSGLARWAPSAFGISRADEYRPWKRLVEHACCPDRRRCRRRPGLIGVVWSSVRRPSAGLTPWLMPPPARHLHSTRLQNSSWRRCWRKFKTRKHSVWSRRMINPGRVGGDSSSQDLQPG